MTIKCEKWVILEIINNGIKYHRIFATWDGSYLRGEEYRVNSGIKEVVDKVLYYEVIGLSGSVYICNKNMYGITDYGLTILGNIPYLSEEDAHNILKSYII